MFGCAQRFNVASVTCSMTTLSTTGEVFKICAKPVCSVGQLILLTSCGCLAPSYWHFKNLKKIFLAEARLGEKHTAHMKEHMDPASYSFC